MFLGDRIRENSLSGTNKILIQKKNFQLLVSVVSERKNTKIKSYG